MTRAPILALLIVAGCKAPCDPTTECPTPTSVRGECMAERTCAIGGAMGWCVSGDCRFERGKTLTVPVGALDLSKTKDLFVDYRTHAAGAPDPTLVDAELDGQKGTATAFEMNGDAAALVTWTPFPKSPKTLTLRFDDGSVKTVDPDFQFEDGGCESDREASCSAF